MTTTTTTTTRHCREVTQVTRIPVSLNDPNYFCNKSWTVSYNMNTKSWISFHSYIPNWYIGENNFFYSGINGCCEDFDFIATTIGTTTTTTSTTTIAPPTTTTTTSTSTTTTSTTSTTTTSTTSTTTTTTTAYVCQRPEDLNNYQLATGYTIESDPEVSFVSTGSQEEACSAEDFILSYTAVDPPIRVDFILAQGESITIGQLLYLGWIETDCTLVPDGWYFTEDMLYSHLVFHVVGGVIVEITPCDATTTTSTTSTTITTTTIMPDVNCGDEVFYDNDGVYEHVYLVDLGTDTGTTFLYFEADVIPDRYIVEWNGSQVIDTGYHGLPIYDFGGLNRGIFNLGLIGKNDPVTGNPYPDMGTYPDDGYPRVDLPTDGWESFSKSAGSPDSAEVHIYSPINDSIGRFTLFCPGISTTTTTTTGIIVESSTVLFNDSDNPSKVYAYYPDTTDSVLLDVPLVPDFEVDIAHTANKLWLLGSGVPVEWDITLSPFSASYNRVISGGLFNSPGLGAIDDTTLIGISGDKVYEVNITVNPATNTEKFSMIPGRSISGDYLLTTTGKFIVTNYVSPYEVYITQYDYSTGDVEVDIEITPTISSPYGIYEYDGDIFIADGSGQLYMIDKDYPYGLTLVDTLPYYINGASQLPSYLTVHFSTTTTTTTIAP